MQLKATGLVIIQRKTLVHLSYSRVQQFIKRIKKLGP